MKRRSLILFASSAALCILHGAYYYPRLPETVFSRFGASGAPDATMSKLGALIAYYGVVALMGGVVLLVSLLVGRASGETLKMPNKAYWLSPSRAGRTRAFLSSHLLWLGVGSMVLMLVVFHLSYRVSLGLAERLPSLGTILGIYAAFTVLWLTALFVRFKLPAGES